MVMSRESVVVYMMGIMFMSLESVGRLDMM